MKLSLPHANPGHGVADAAAEEAGAGATLGGVGTPVGTPADGVGPAFVGGALPAGWKENAELRAGVGFFDALPLAEDLAVAFGETVLRGSVATGNGR